MPDPVIPPPEVPEVVLDPVPAPDAPVPDPETEKAAAPADLEKGMGHVSDLAWMLKSLSYLVADQAAEALREGDQSKIPARLQAWLEAGAKILQAMTAEEVAELAATSAASIDLIADATSAPTTDPMGNPIALAAAVTDLEKKGSRNSKQDAERLTQIHDLLVALHPGVCPQVPDSQVAEDQGASSSAKAEAADDLQKAAALTEEALAKVADLEKILLRTKNATVKQYSKLFAMDGVRLRFTPDAVKAIAAKAIELKTGARALRSIMENLMLEVMYELPQRDDVTEVVIDAGVVAGRRRPTLRRASKTEPKQHAA